MAGSSLAGANYRKMSPRSELWDLLLYNVVQLEMFGSRTCVMTTPYEVNLMQIND